jgi:REP element-mobilizing transposase RayT
MQLRLTVKGVKDQWHYLKRNLISIAKGVYHCYLHWLEEAARACGCAIHAHVLMTNHVHLLLTPAETGAPSRLMQSLGRRYVQYANRFYRRSGSLREGRYKSSVVQTENYLLACQCGQRGQAQIKSSANSPAGCHSHPRCPQAMEICRQRYPETSSVSATHTVNCHLIG